MENSLPILGVVALVVFQLFFLFFIYNAIDRNNVAGEQEHNPWPLTLLGILFYPFIAIWVGYKFEHRPLLIFGVLQIVGGIAALVI